MRVWADVLAVVANPVKAAGHPNRHPARNEVLCAQRLGFREEPSATVATNLASVADIESFVEALFRGATTKEAILAAFRLEHPEFISRPIVSLENGKSVVVHGHFQASSVDCGYALDRLYEAQGRRAIPMILDLKSEPTRAF